MVRLSFIISMALAAQGIQAAPAERNDNVEPRNSVIQQAQNVPASYSGGHEKRDNSCPSDNSANEKDNKTPVPKPPKFPNANLNPEVPNRTPEEEKAFQQKLEEQAARQEAAKKQKEGQRGDSKFNTTPEGKEVIQRRIQQDFGLIRDIPNLKFAFEKDATLKFQLETKLQAAEDDLVQNIGKPDFRTRVEQHFAEFNKIPNIQFAMDKDATLKFQLPKKLNEAKQDLLKLA